MPESPSIAERLKELRVSASPKLSVRGLAEKLGVPLSTYATYENEGRFKKDHLPQALTKRLADVLAEHGVPREEVLALAGISPSGDLMQSPESLAEQIDAVLLPEIQVEYSMGGGSTIDDFPVIQQVPFSRSWLSSLTRSPASSLFVARGQGDSMMPTIMDQDIVIIDGSEKTMRQQDRIWAVMYGGFGMIKRLRALPNGVLQINSDNSAVSPIEASDGEAFLVGRVVAVIRRI